MAKVAAIAWRVLYLYRVAAEVRIQIPNTNRQPLRHLSGTQLGNEWARPRKTMVTGRGTYVRSTYCVRIRKTPELPVTIGTGANLTC